MNRINRINRSSIRKRRRIVVPNDPARGRTVQARSRNFQNDDLIQRRIVNHPWIRNLHNHAHNATARHCPSRSVRVRGGNDRIYLVGVHWRIIGRNWGRTDRVVRGVSSHKAIDRNLDIPVKITALVVQNVIHFVPRLQRDDRRWPNRRGSSMIRQTRKRHRIARGHQVSGVIRPRDHPERSRKKMRSINTKRRVNPNRERLERIRDTHRKVSGRRGLSSEWVPRGRKDVVRKNRDVRFEGRPGRKRNQALRGAPALKEGGKGNNNRTNPIQGSKDSNF